MSYSYEFSQDLEWRSAVSWEMSDTPFMAFKFWSALINSGAIGESSGWLPVYIILYEDNSDLPIAVMPLFIKDHHQGEYVFDFAWAEAYARYGLDYYPRLVTSVPYTPVSGERFWLAKGVQLNKHIWQTAITAIDEIAKQSNASSWHGLFLNEHQVELLNQLPNPLAEHQYIQREGYQFVWQNQKLNKDNNDDTSFTNFDDFLSTLTAKKRKNIRAERKKILKQNLVCGQKVGEEITEHDWEVFYQCYAMTYAVRGRQPYLTPAFFKQIAQTMPANLMMAQAVDENKHIVACSLFFYDNPATTNATLYGRYWGALAEYDSLHFELCYYQGIEFAIKKGLNFFDPGTQGEHKLIRGFVPQKTFSMHRIYDSRFEPAIVHFCQQDREYMRQYRKQAHQALPFNIDNMPDFKG